MKWSALSGTWCLSQSRDVGRLASTRPSRRLQPTLETRARKKRNDRRDEHSDGHARVGEAGDRLQPPMGRAASASRAWIAYAGPP